MNEKIDMNKSFLAFQKKISTTDNWNKAIQEVMQEQIKILPAGVQKNVMNTLLETMTLNESIKDVSKIETPIILKNTLSNFTYNFTEEQIAIFNKLIVYDKSCIIKNKRVFFRLNTLIEKILSHLEALDKLEKLKNEDIYKKGIACTSHPTVKDALDPRISQIEESIKLNNTNSNKTQLNIYKDFEKNPLEINAMYSVLPQFPKDSFSNENKDSVDTLYNTGEHLNSATKIEDYHIYKSAQITSFLIYRNTTMFNLHLQMKISPTNVDLALYVDTLTKSFFEDLFDTKLTRHHITKPIQLKSYFGKIEIYEYRTKSNYKEHPLFEDV